MDDPVVSSACLTCGAPAPVGAAFCPQCGTRLDGGEAPPGVPDGGAGARLERHLFGVAPPRLLLALIFVVLAFAVFCLAGGHLLVGVVLLALALGLGAVLVSTARLIEGRLGRVVVGVREETRGRAGFAWVSLTSWSAAGREAVRLRALQLRLRREQSDLIRALGEAVYTDDEEHAAALKLAARERGDRIDACASELQLALESARARVSNERAAIQPTRVLAGGLDDADAGRSNKSSE
jgi:hypothetical protein